MHHPSHTPQELTQRIKAQALALGFDLVGVAPVQESPELAFFARWLDAGYAGEMHYLARSRERRRDLQQVVPGAQSVVVCGLNYDTAYPYSTTQTDPERGWIARYAWGEDYHQVMHTMLEQLQHCVTALLPAHAASKVYVDTGPILERVYAKYAGLGWFGKNTCVLNARLGSWFLLGELIVSVPLTYDQPTLDHCGTCTRCLDACPTQALVAPYVLDAQRCISYLTIELKGAIPEPLRSPMGQHIFGCDICQDVCPWNRKRQVTTMPALAPRAIQQHPFLAELAGMTPAEFRQHFRGTALERSKRRGLLRNVCVAMGNSGHTAFIPLLESLLEDQEALVREHAAWALAQLRARVPTPAGLLM
ncbi:MAG: tRNA epoxyqueuosine(34) reductase QueG [Candidatus Tectomicrobia bacterium]|uniref:Epoxyqueuosine reductase n=1 Tax=Tectimicrobiota bacterium TaxID=2528274 RepID=A0A937W0L2_UNCTE|nr:tRNA epoxyqueuosine(34) reductase QueG [Candidatus Tectomicrobia bacterium]